MKVNLLVDFARSNPNMEEETRHPKVKGGWEEGVFSSRSLGSAIHSMCSRGLVSFPFSIIRDEDGICRC